MANKRMDACTPRPKYGGGTWWHKVGSAVQSEDGKITIYLDSCPLPDKESGNIKIMLFEQKDRDSDKNSQEQTERKPAEKRKTNTRKDDDEIPF